MSENGERLYKCPFCGMDMVMKQEQSPESTLFYGECMACGELLKGHWTCVSCGEPLGRDTDVLLCNECIRMLK